MTARKTPYNSTFAIGGVTCFYDTFVVKGSSVLRMNICAEKPAHRKSAKRCAACLDEIPEFRKSRQQIKTKLIIGQQNKLTINKIITFENQLKTK